MRICEIVPSLEERYGGPSKSAYALSQALAGLGHDVTLLATHPTTPTNRELGSLTLRVFRRGQPQMLCPSRGLRQDLRHTAADIVHHHSIWLRTLHYAATTASRLSVPLVVSPRGMMTPWAWNHHRLRKTIVARVVHPGAFERASGWHATSEQEASDIRTLGFQQPICVAPNGVQRPPEADAALARTYWHKACPATAHRRTALFYSRFHQKKRVLELIDLWLETAPADWLLLLVGLPDDYTSAQLEAYVLRSSGGGRIHVHDGESRPPPYSAASLFLLPSHSENFGMVVAEAMANGVPVVVTDSTPWADINRLGAGWCVPWLDYREALKQALASTEDSLRERGERARAYVLTHYSWQHSADRLLRFYRELAHPHA